MSSFDQSQFNSFIIEHKVIGFFDSPVTLKSGRTSHWYINWRRITEDVYLTEQLTQFVINFVGDLITKGDLPSGIDCFYGIPEGATKLGVVTQYHWAKAQLDYAPGRYPLSMGRAKSKDHGDVRDRYFVGAPRGKTLLLEDVTTTGLSLLQSLDSLIESKFEVIGAISLSDRGELRDDGESVQKAVSHRLSFVGGAMPYFSMSRASELLPTACEEAKTSRAVRESIVEEFTRYGVDKISL